MKSFKSPSDAKRRNRQAFQKLKDLEAGTFRLAPGAIYESARHMGDIYMRNNSSFTIKVTLEGFKK